MKYGCARQDGSRRVGVDALDHTHGTSVVAEASPAPERVEHERPTAEESEKARQRDAVAIGRDEPEHQHNHQNEQHDRHRVSAPERWCAPTASMKTCPPRSDRRDRTDVPPRVEAKEHEPDRNQWHHDGPEHARAS